MTTSRVAVLVEAALLVGDHGKVKDYACACDPGGERFIVSWTGDPLDTCYNIEELRRKVGTKPSG